MKKLLKVIILCICLSMPSYVIAHSGRTDSSGGHKDNNNKSGLGPYHYHCGGHPPHLHDSGKCPYSSESQIEDEPIIESKILITSPTNTPTSTPTSTVEPTETPTNTPIETQITPSKDVNLSTDKVNDKVVTSSKTDSNPIGGIIVISMIGFVVYKFSIKSKKVK